MPEPDSFLPLLDRLRAGDDDAAAAVFRRFAQRLIALARGEMEAWLRRKVDPEDVVQSVYRSFFTRCARGEFELDGWDDLWGLLAVITLRKCVNRRAHHRAQYHDALREQPLEAAADPGAIDRAPTPLEAAMLTDEVEQLLRGLEAPERAIIELTLQGCSTEQISGQLGRAERAVQRVRQHVKEYLLRAARS